MKKAEVAYTKLKETNNEVKVVNDKLKEKNHQLADTQFKIIKFIAEVLGSHDLYTGRHVIHTQKYVEIICNEMVKLGYYTKELTPGYISLFSTAAFLHDIHHMSAERSTLILLHFLKNLGSTALHSVPFV